MKQSAALFFALGSAFAAVAQTTTKLDVVVPYFGNSSFHASCKDASPAATTYILGCEADTNAEGCAGEETAVIGTHWAGITIIEGPSTVAVHRTISESDMSLGYEGSTEGDSMYFQEVQTASGRTFRLGNWVVGKRDFIVSLTVTAGVEKMTQQATAEATATAAESAPRTGASATTGQAGPTSTPNAAAAVGPLGLLAAAVAGVAGVVGMF